MFNNLLLSIYTVALNEAQRKQVERQLAQHQHTRYNVDIQLSPDKVLRGFIVNQNVMRPEKMTSLRLARFLWENHHIYRDTEAMDMGCGTGLQGITMTLNGAAYVYFSDISVEAFANTVENVHQFCPKGKAVIVQGDLFEKMPGKVDVIVFNHPFFPESPEKYEPVAATMLDPGTLIQRFFQDSRAHLTKAGKIIMPFFHLAGTENDPQVQGPKNGYEVRTMAHVDVIDGLQKGLVSFYELRPR